MEFSLFKDKVRGSFKLDLNSYKENQLKRRLDNLMVKQNVSTGNYAEFFNLLTVDRSAYMEFLDTITINVSEFFRDKPIFDTLENNIIPSLLDDRKRLKIWSAACSSGAEPYSIAIILNELSPGRNHYILGSDIDKKVLKAAQEGCYHEDQVINVNRRRQARYFTRQGDKYYLTQSIKKMVSFKHHDLLLSLFDHGFDLISCRNVVIYFTREAQEKLYLKFHRALNPGGILFIGASEMIFNYREFGYEKLATCFYRKK
ncbi:CheR family methyltransferase [Pelotomaculum propionicicum]|uniref:CheR family methyltransferase n=1 Tax=Pelotomaculum propionicicum TaxID=258475 RepID=UPI003B7EB473